MKGIVLGVSVFAFFGGIASATAPNPYSESSVDMITKWYQGYLLRSPDAGGLEYWNTEVKNGVCKPGAMALMGAVNYQGENGVILTNTQFVTRVYNGFLQRAPDTAGLNYWVGQLNNGVSRASVASSIIDSPEFVDSCTQATKVQLTQGGAFVDQDALNIFHPNDILKGNHKNGVLATAIGLPVARFSMTNSVTNFIYGPYIKINKGQHSVSLNLSADYTTTAAKITLDINRIKANGTSQVIATKTVPLNVYPRPNPLVSIDFNNASGDINDIYEFRASYISGGSPITLDVSNIMVTSSGAGF